MNSIKILSKNLTSVSGICCYNILFHWSLFSSIQVLPWYDWTSFSWRKSSEYLYEPLQFGPETFFISKLLLLICWYWWQCKQIKTKYVEDVCRFCKSWSWHKNQLRNFFSRSIFLIGSSFRRGSILNFGSNNGWLFRFVHRQKYILI